MNCSRTESPAPPYSRGHEGAIQPREASALAKRLGLYGAGQDLLSDSFSGNLRGIWFLSHAELGRRERSEKC